ncbi:MAG: c-type cytochrome [Planctomycetaceae bacterium]|nr:c-type cytochrome [Planctomycetaceae bacterium]
MQKQDQPSCWNCSDRSKKSSDPEVAKHFLDAAEQSRFVLSLPVPEVSDIIKRFPAELRPRGNALLDQVVKNEAAKLARIDQLIPLLDQGNPHKGKELFFAEKSKCATCHQINSEGKQVGPNLSNIGANRAPRDLLESIIFPSSTIVRDYESFNVVLTDGRVLTGLIIREDSDNLDLQQQTGKIDRLLKEDIEEVVPNTVSIMPNGLEKTLTEAELADVIAYLMTLKKPQLAQKP